MTVAYSQLSILNDSRAQAALADLHQRSSRQNAKLVTRLLPHLPRMLFRAPLPWSKIEPKLSDLYLAMDPDNGVLCYLLARALKARRIVEFGSSFGISTISLALAAWDNGGGVVIATERVAAKAEQARKNIAKAGVEEFVDLREGDAFETLRDVQMPIDMFINDAFPAGALPMLQSLAPRLRQGSITLCGNAALFPADHADYVAWVRDPSNGFCSTQLGLALSGECSVRVATQSRD